MKTLFFWFLIPSLVLGQNTFYDNIQLGTYGVGYYDTVIYNEMIDYDQYTYHGKLPIFVQVWHPIKKQPDKNLLIYNDFRKREYLPGNLKLIYDEVCSYADSSFISYNLKEEVYTYKKISYGNHSYADVLNSIKTCKTKSSYIELKGKTKFPVIIYHHGSEGFSDENYIMAEYFASSGYIFISANFHLPYTGMPYGLKEGVTNDQTSAQAVAKFAKTLSANNSMFFIGHSWGAQQGWCYLHEPGWVDAFVSMETTIEFKKDTIEIKDKWPFVYETIRNRNKQFNIPILMIANTGKDRPFSFFENKSAKKMMYVSAKEEFMHESYTSGYLMRYFYRDMYKQPDTESLKKQIDLYSEHLNLINAFFESVLLKKTFNATIYKDHFYIN